MDNNFEKLENFIFINDKKYWKTGDLGFIDSNQRLKIIGRKSSCFKLAQGFFLKK